MNKLSHKIRKTFQAERKGEQVEEFSSWFEFCTEEIQRNKKDFNELLGIKIVNAVANIVTLMDERKDDLSKITKMEIFPVNMDGITSRKAPKMKLRLDCVVTFAS